MARRPRQLGLRRSLDRGRSKRGSCTLSNLHCRSGLLTRTTFCSEDLAGFGICTYGNFQVLSASTSVQLRNLGQQPHLTSFFPCEWCRNQLSLSKWASQDE